MIETRWGLGLESITDLPDENTYMFGLVSVNPGDDVF